MPATDYYFCYDPNQTTSLVTIMITDKAFYDENMAFSDWELLEDVMEHIYGIAGSDPRAAAMENWGEFMADSWDEVTEGTFSFLGNIETAVGLLRRAGFIEKQDLLVPFGQAIYQTLSLSLCEDAVDNFLSGIAPDGEPLDEDDENSLAAALDEDIERNVFSAQAGITPDMTTADILAVARRRMADQRREYDEKQNSEAVNVEIEKVSRYDSDWDKSVIFKGFNFRVVLRDEDSIIRRMSILRDVENKLAEFLKEGDYIVQTNDDTDEMEVYLKSTRAIIVWKMEDAQFFTSKVERIEQHEG